MNNTNNFKNKTICLSGFSEDKIFKNFLIKKYKANFTDVVTKKTDYVIVKEFDKPYPSSKIKIAYKYNIPVIKFLYSKIT